MIPKEQIITEIQWNVVNWADVYAFITPLCADMESYRRNADDTLTINTTGGIEFIVNAGDWIGKDDKGHLSLISKKKTTYIKENVNHPSHYTQGKIEVIEAIEDWKCGFHDGNVIKYVARYRHKNGIEDLKKAKWYLERLIKNIEGKP